MKNHRLLPVLIILILSLASCEKDSDPDFNVVINELMAYNTVTQADQNGEYDDWIELCNKSSKELDLGGYYLSDTKSKPDKWRVPDNTRIQPHGFLIIWADNDTLQTGLHANFKLSADGEKLYFVNPELLVVDKIEYPAQYLEKSFARNPDWKGAFVWQAPTFSSSNNISK